MWLSPHIWYTKWFSSLQMISFNSCISMSIYWILQQGVMQRRVSGILLLFKTCSFHIICLGTLRIHVADILFNGLWRISHDVNTDGICAKIYVQKQEFVIFARDQVFKIAWLFFQEWIDYFHCCFVNRTPKSSYWLLEDEGRFCDNRRNLFCSCCGLQWTGIKIVEFVCCAHYLLTDSLKVPLWLGKTHHLICCKPLESFVVLITEDETSHLSMVH